MVFLSQQRISEIQETYKLASYQLLALDKLVALCQLQGKRVLEVGGSNLPRELVIGDLGCSQWVSVDFIPPGHYALTQQSKHYQMEKIYQLSEAENFISSDSYVIFNGFAENISPCFYDSFDVVFSVSSFEHILRLPTVIQRIYDSLTSNGMLYTHFAPIWSCRVGHHFWLTPELNFNSLGEIPEFGHLLMRPFEMLNYLSQFYSTETCEEIVYQMYFRDYTNRLFYEDYEILMCHSAFEKYSLYPTGTTPVDNETLSKLITLYPGRSRFEVYGIQLEAYK